MYMTDTDRLASNWNLIKQKELQFRYAVYRIWEIPRDIFQRFIDMRRTVYVWFHLTYDT